MTIWLILHVLAGLAGTLWYGASWLGLERKDPLLGRLKKYTLFGLLAMLVSWITAALYYTGYYGGTVRRVIIDGPYPWAHEFFMEAKEHVFLFLPLLSLAVTLMFWMLGDRLWTQPGLQSLTAKLLGVIVTIGSLMAIMGVVASGAVR